MDVVNRTASASGSHANGPDAASLARLHNDLVYLRNARKDKKTKTTKDLAVHIVDHLHEVHASFRQLSPSSANYSNAWRQLSSFYKGTETLGVTGQRIREKTQRDLRELVDGCLAHARGLVQMHGPLSSQAIEAENVYSTLANYAPVKECRAVAAQALTALRQERDLAEKTVLPSPPRPPTPASKLAVPRGILTPPQNVQDEVFPHTRLGGPEVPPMPSYGDFFADLSQDNPMFGFDVHANDDVLSFLPQEAYVWDPSFFMDPLSYDMGLPTASPTPPSLKEVRKASFEDLEALQAALRKWLGSKTPEDAIGPIQASARTVLQTIRNAASLYPALGEELWSNHRSLVRSALKRAPDSLREPLEKIGAEIVAHDIKQLGALETALHQGGMEIEALRKACLAIKKYGMSDDVRLAAKTVWNQIDAMHPGPLAPTKKTWTRAEITEVELPAGMDKIVEMTSILTGKCYYATETIAQGTYGKYRLAVDDTGKRLGIKVQRLSGGVADTLKLGKVLENGYVEEPTAAATLESAREEVNAIRDASEHLEVIDVIEFEGKYYAFVTGMEDSLASIGKRVPERARREDIAQYAFGQLAQEINVLHTSKNRVHGDLKELNVLLGPGGVVAASDWGSSFIPGEIAQTDLVSTYPPPGYKAGWGKDADMWALGALVVNMLKTTTDDPFLFSAFAAKEASYARWYGAIPTDDQGHLNVDALPNESAEDAAWCELFAGIRDTSPELCRLVLEGLLNPQASERWTAETLAERYHVPDDVQQRARAAIDAMVESSDKEPKYQALEAFAKTRFLSMFLNDDYLVA